MDTIQRSSVQKITYTCADLFIVRRYYTNNNINHQPLGPTLQIICLFRISEQLKLSSGREGMLLSLISKVLHLKLLTAQK